MKALPAVLALLLAPAIAMPAGAVPGGRIGTLPNGVYRCELPGDAMGPIGHRRPDEDFAILTSSTYRRGDARGSYPLTGDMVVMTGGAMKGYRFRRSGTNFLRLVNPDGTDATLRCIRRRGTGA